MNNKTAADYLKEPYARILIPEEDGSFSAEILEFPGCFAQGETPAKAFENLQNAALSWVEVALSRKQEIPPPSVTHGYGGKVALRLPRSLHKLAARRAARDGVSLNQCLVTAIAAWLGADGLYQRMAESLRHTIVIDTKVSFQAFAESPNVFGYMSDPGAIGWTANKVGLSGWHAPSGAPINLDTLRHSGVPSNG